MNNDSSEEFDSNPFNFRPLKRRKNPLLKSQKAKRVKNTNPIPSQKPTFVQKTLNIRTETEKPVEQQRKIAGILVSLRETKSNAVVLDISVCPVCQLPLDLLKGLVSPDVHIADCKGTKALPVPSDLYSICIRSESRVGVLP